MLNVGGFERIYHRRRRRLVPAEHVADFRARKGTVRFAGGKKSFPGGLLDGASGPVTRSTEVGHEGDGSP
jgi:hypothetical protein